MNLKISDIFFGLFLCVQTTVSASFSTSLSIDNDRPIISELKASTLDKGTVVSWKTNEITNSHISIRGLSENNLYIYADLLYSKAHTVNFPQLKMGENYILHLKSVDISGNIRNSSLSIAVESDDSDNDGVKNNDDMFPLDPNESEDSDNDGIGNNSDTDDDNDGVLDVNDAFPLDASESLDTDHDGIGNNTDTDDDNDGISDTLEIANGLNPLNASDGQADLDGDGFSNAMEIQIGTDIRNASSKPVWTPIMMGDIVTFVPALP